MAAIDPAEEIKELSAKLTGVETVLDLDAMRREVAELRDQAADRRLWDDQERAQTVTRKLSHFESELGRVESLRRRLDDLPIMLELAESEDDEPTRQEAERELGALRQEIKQEPQDLPAVPQQVAEDTLLTILRRALQRQIQNKTPAEAGLALAGSYLEREEGRQCLERHLVERRDARGRQLQLLLRRFVGERDRPCARRDALWQSLLLGDVGPKRRGECRA